PARSRATRAASAILRQAKKALMPVHIVFKCLKVLAKVTAIHPFLPKAPAILDKVPPCLKATYRAPNASLATPLLLQAAPKAVMAARPPPLNRNLPIENNPGIKENNPVPIPLTIPNIFPKVDLGDPSFFLVALLYPSLSLPYPLPKRSRHEPSLTPSPSTSANPLAIPLIRLRRCFIRYNLS